MSALITDETIARLKDNQYSSDVPARWIRSMAMEIELGRAKIKELRAALVMAHDGVLAGLDDKELLEILGNYGGISQDEE